MDFPSLAIGLKYVDIPTPQTGGHSGGSKYHRIIEALKQAPPNKAVEIDLHSFPKFRGNNVYNWYCHFPTGTKLHGQEVKHPTTKRVLVIKIWKD